MRTLEEIKKMVVDAGLPPFGSAEFNNLCSIFFGGGSKEKAELLNNETIPQATNSNETA